MISKTKKIVPTMNPPTNTPVHAQEKHARWSLYALPSGIASRNSAAAEQAIPFCKNQHRALDKFSVKWYSNTIYNADGSYKMKLNMKAAEYFSYYYFFFTEGTK